MENSLLSELQTLLGSGGLLLNEALSKHTSFRIGGPCAFMALPSDTNTLVETIGLAKKYRVPYFIMGNGTNLLCSDEGYDGIVIKTTGINGVSVDGDGIAADCGATLAKTASAALGASLTGLEFAHGIPGSVGGGVVMNAGAYGGEIKDAAIKTRCLTDGGRIAEITGDEHEFGYRKSVFSGSSMIVLRTVFRLKNGDPEVIRSRMAELAAKRKSSQPLDMPSAGSVFKRPEGYYTGKLIDECGLRGFSIGGAQISNKHSGFIVNTGGATAKDVLMLITHIREMVYARCGVTLECEIKILK
jgi:UDP-N-acetylmuramate dehydrogenase